MPAPFSPSRACTESDSSRRLAPSRARTPGKSSVTHTGLEPQPWWQVDLGTSQPIGEVAVWNRTDCCADRLTDYYVLVSETPLPTSLAQALATPGVRAFHQTATSGRPTTVPVGVTGRHVRVQLAGTDYLSLAEVQVFS
ncbi:discoidin domain-containing protein [Nonomuraea sp. NPDC049152]|uniref:galactose-binding domain-containing protein n=1 Tax=Nonomuraea sp. NPDC049152 TaxID=3154350 RepID=UPI003402C7A2